MPLVNSYDGIYHLLQIVPPDVSSIIIEVDSSLQKIFLNPAQPEWHMLFHARRLHAIVTNFAQVSFARLHPQTMKFSKIISQSPGPPLLNVDNIVLLYNSITARI